MSNHCCIPLLFCWVTFWAGIPRLVFLHSLGYICLFPAVDRETQGCTHNDREWDSSSWGNKQKMPCLPSDWTRLFCSPYLWESYSWETFLKASSAFFLLKSSGCDLGSWMSAHLFCTVLLITADKGNYSYRELPCGWDIKWVVLGHVLIC